MCYTAANMKGIFPLLMIFIEFSNVVEVASKRKIKCEPLTIKLCKGLGYNMTTMPNKMGHDTQWEAKQSIAEFQPLMKAGCARHVRLFVCSVFAPLCDGDVDYPVHACRSMCNEMREGCSYLLDKFGFNWPAQFKCSTFPIYSEKKDSKLCMREPGSSSRIPFPKGRTNIYKLLNKTTSDVIHKTKTEIITYPTSGLNATFASGRSKTCVNTKKFVQVKIRNKEYCAVKCDADIFFTQTNKQFSDIWLLIWSVICFLSTLTTVLTYLIDRTRFKYPERPIIYLAFCYNLYSTAYLIRLVAKREGVSCSDEGNYLIIDGLNTAGCSVVFILLYFFGMASSLWWVVLTLTWFLSAAMKWSQEAIANKSVYFHAVSWVVPAVQTIVALAARKVDADELTGLCYVGNQNVENLAGFVLAPLCVYLVIGTTFLLAGFISLFRIRSVLKDCDTNTRKLEKLMVRIGVFSVLYTLPATAVIACFVYQYSNLDAWRDDVERNCQRFLIDECKMSSRPKEEIYMVRHFMSLVVGITSGMWVWSSKTCQSWKLCYRRNLTHKYPQRPPMKSQRLIVHTSTEKQTPITTTQNRPVTEFTEHCVPSELSHPLTNFTTQTNGQFSSGFASMQ